LLKNSTTADKEGVKPHACHPLSLGMLLKKKKRKIRKGLGIKTIEATEVQVGLCGLAPKNEGSFLGGVETGAAEEGR